MADELTSYLMSLIRSCHRNDIEKARSLIKTDGIPGSKESSNGYKLLCCALEYPHWEFAKMLLTMGAKVNCNTRSDFDDTPLHTAVLHGNISFVSLLLEKKADVNAFDYAHRTPLHHALSINLNRRNIVRLLIESDGFKDPRVEPILSKLNAALEADDFRIIKELLNHTKWRNETCTKLHVAVFEQDESRVESLLNEAFDINAKMTDGKTPLHTASIFADEKVVELLLKRGADIEATDVYDATPLHFAARFGRPDIIKILLLNKANVNALQEDGDTPLHYAVLENNPTIVNMLLDASAAVSPINDKESTPLYIASSRGFDKIVKILAERNAHMDAEDGSNSPLHVAAKRKHDDVVELLLDFGASVDAKAKGGRTALHYAAQYECPNIARILLHYGADVNIICDYNSKTPFEYANSRIIQFHRDNSVFEDDTQIIPDNESVAEVLEQHILEMIALDLHVSEANFKALNDFYAARNVNGDPVSELATMKRKKIGDSNVTFYDVFNGSDNQLVTYSRNERIVEAIESNDIYDDFPLYSDRIKCNIRQGGGRRNLFELCLNPINKLFGRVVPHFFAIECFTYLNNLDLLNLINTYPTKDEGGI